jgi:outer membrane protein OmpA-like peptidoglycan-associated protein
MKLVASAILGILLLATQALANVIGTDAQNFNPTSNGIDFVTVQSARTLDPGILNFGFFLNYAVNTLSFLEQADPQVVQNRTTLNDRLLSADISFGLGLTKRLDFGLSLPVLLRQDIANDSQVAYFASTGNTEKRLNLKYKFYDTETWANALVFTVNQNNIQDNPYTGRDPGLTQAVEYASSWKWRDSWLGINLGHRWRNPGQSLASTFGIAPLPNMYVYSIAWSRMLASNDSKVIFEVFGSTPSASNNDVNLSDRQQSNLEALAGLKHDYNENIALHFGAGTELAQGFGTPDWRVYAGLNWTMGPIWRKSIPQQVAKAPPARAQKFILTNPRFKFDSEELEPESLKEVEQIIEIIAKTPHVEKVVVEGHSDSKGEEEYNMRLSTRRALAVKKLISVKVPMDISRIESEGYGESRPIADNSNYQGRAKNRRVVVIVYKRKAGPAGEDSLIEIRLTE